jgi:hypothetical protein
MRPEASDDLFGVGHDFYTRSYPATFPHICVTIYWLVDVLDRNREYHFRVEIADEDGRVLAADDGQYKLADGFKPDDLAGFYIDFNTVTVKGPFVTDVRVFIDGELRYTVPINFRPTH